MHKTGQTVSSDTIHGVEKKNKKEQKYTTCQLTVMVNHHIM